MRTKATVVVGIKIELKRQQQWTPASALLSQGVWYLKMAPSGRVSFTEKCANLASMNVLHHPVSEKELCSDFLS